MKLRLSLPSKTFLVGDYLALEQGPSLVLGTDPRFELLAQLSDEGGCAGIHPDSPAGLWMRQSSESYQNLKLEFLDPHNGAGGFGASSAQFAFCYFVETIQRAHVFKVNSNISYERVWKAFKSMTYNSSGRSPSGADVVGQVCGGISSFTQSPFGVTKSQWEFRSQGFALVHMGQKINTHDHLNQLKTIPSAALMESFNHVDKSLKLGNWAGLCEGVSQYANTLKDFNLTCDRTLEFCEAAKKVDGVDAVKGCGALGADVALILFDKTKLKSIVEFLKTQPVKLVADDTKLSAGLDVKLDILQADPLVATANKGYNTEPSGEIGL